MNVSLLYRTTLRIVMAFSLCILYLACGGEPTEPCKANAVRTCKCIGPKVNDERKCILGEQACKSNGTGYLPCRCIPEDTLKEKADPLVSCEGDPHPPKPSS